MGVLTFPHLFVGSFAESNGASRAVFISLLIPCCLTVDYSAPPIFPNKSFVWVWNVPTEDCERKFKVPLDISLYSVVGSPRKGLTGQGITLFYTDRLGYYPYINEKNHSSVYGGIPQLGNLQEHLEKAKNDTLYYLPLDNFGLAVIDWEDWRPTWDRNWALKDIYRKKSIELVQQKNPELNVTEATKIAKAEFEKTGREFMEETLKLGKSTRPKQLWGYYLFPDCYNHNYKNENYTGACNDIEKQRNDNLHWMWKESTGLYPSIYLNSKLQSNPQAALFSRNRVYESLRVSIVGSATNPLPIFVYARMVLTDVTSQFLNEVDLVHTMGETIALGASGMIVWGTLNLARDAEACSELKEYMKVTMNPYIINITLAAKMCSQALCQDNGICVRKDWNSGDYLHLNPTNLAIQVGQDEKFTIEGKPTLEDLQQFSEKFQCRCYPDTKCEQTTDLKTVSSINVCAAEGLCISASLKPETAGGDGGGDGDPASNAPVSPRVLRNDVSGGLLILYMYSQHLKYLT